MLLPDELQKLDRFQRQFNKDQFAVSRGALRFLSGKYSNRLPGEFILRVDENKKPYWQNDALHFNMAHSGEYVLIAFANTAVGVDVEKTNQLFNYDEIMPTCFDQQEINEVNNAPDPLTLFYTFWTRKEALIKATSKGIDNDLPSIPSIAGTYSVNERLIGSEKNWAIKSFEVDEHHIAGIAHDPSVDTIRFLNFDI
jgi:4'-phosphopantetheinyl transferase